MIKKKIKAFFIAIVDKYQEQPHLLDPHLGKTISHVISHVIYFFVELIISKIFDLVRREEAPPNLMHHAFKYLYLFSKVKKFCNFDSV